MKTLLVWSLCAVALVILMTTCGQTPTPEEQEEALRRQVQRWWAARQLRDHDTMYEMYEPAYRARANRTQFLKESLVRTRFAIISHEVREITRETLTRAKVNITFRFLHPRLGGELPGRVEETWILTEGNWFKEYKPIEPPFPRSSDPAKSTLP